MSAYIFGGVFIVLVATAQATLFSSEEHLDLGPRNDASYGNYLIVPAEIDKLKRSFGRNCMFTISGCFTTSQAERYRKYMENVGSIPK